MMFMITMFTSMIMMLVLSRMVSMIMQLSVFMNAMIMVSIIMDVLVMFLVMLKMRRLLLQIEENIADEGLWWGSNDTVPHILYVEKSIKYNS